MEETWSVQASSNPWFYRKFKGFEWFGAVGWGARRLKNYRRCVKSNDFYGFGMRGLGERGAPELQKVFENRRRFMVLCGWVGARKSSIEFSMILGRPRPGPIIDKGMKCMKKQ